MSMKMQVDVNNLEAHINVLDHRLSEAEDQICSLVDTLNTLAFGPTEKAKGLRIIKQDQMPSPRKPRKKT